MTLRFVIDNDDDRYNYYTGLVGTVTFVNRDTIPGLGFNVSRCSTQSIISKSGTIFSTNVLNAYYHQNSATCTWVIQAPIGFVPVISFNENYRDTGIEIYNGDEDDNIFTLWGSPEKITGASSNMTIRFVKDNPDNYYTGVVGTVTFVNRDTIPGLGFNVYRCSTQSIISKSGTIFSTNDLNAYYYQNKATCTWVIQAPTGFVPFISFTQFIMGPIPSDISNMVTYAYNYFNIYNGDIARNNLIFRLSGPRNITGYTPKMTLQITPTKYYMTSGRRRRSHQSDDKSESALSYVVSIVGTVTFIPK